MDQNNNIITIIPFNLVCSSNLKSKNILNITNYTNNDPIYVIHNDLVCQKHEVLPYLNNLKLNDFNIEKLSEKEFCKKFFTRDAGSGLYKTVEYEAQSKP